MNPKTLNPPVAGKKYNSLTTNSITMLETTTSIRTEELKSLDPHLPATQQLSPNHGIGGTVWIGDVGREIVDGKPGNPTLKGVKYYTARPACMIVDGDYVVMPAEVSEITGETIDYHRDVLGITNATRDAIIPIEVNGHPDLTTAAAEFLLSPQGRSLIQEKDINALYPYIGCSITSRIRDELNLLLPNDGQIAQSVNHKGRQMEAFRKAGVRVPDSIFTTSEAEANAGFAQLKAKGYSEGSIKLCRAASAMGLEKFEFKSPKGFEVKLNLPRMVASTQTPGLLIEEWRTNVKAEPGILVHLGNTQSEDRLLAASDQYTKNHEHQSSAGPTKWWSLSIIREMTYIVMEEIRRMGYRGQMSVDFICEPNPQTGELMIRPIVHVTEANCRMTGQSHGAMLVHNIDGTTMNPERQWAAANNIAMPKGITLQEYRKHLKTKGIEYDSDTERGIIIASIAIANVGQYPKGMVVAVGYETRQALMHALSEANMAA
jgi:hypothetical protein